MLSYYLGGFVMKITFPKFITMSLVAENEEERKLLQELMDRIIRATPLGHHPVLSLNGVVNMDEENRMIEEIEFN